MHEEHCLKSGSVAFLLCIHSYICTHRQTLTQRDHLAASDQEVVPSAATTTQQHFSLLCSELAGATTVQQLCESELEAF